MVTFLRSYALCLPHSRLLVFALRHDKDHAKLLIFASRNDRAGIDVMKPCLLPKLPVAHRNVRFCAGAAMAENSGKRTVRLQEAVAVGGRLIVR